MKCPCGYFYEHEWNRDATYEGDGGGTIPFTKINGSFHIDETEYGWYTVNRIVHLYACPECGTTKMVRD